MHTYIRRVYTRIQMVIEVKWRLYAFDVCPVYAESLLVTVVVTLRVSMQRTNSIYPCKIEEYAVRIELLPNLASRPACALTWRVIKNFRNLPVRSI